MIGACATCFYWRTGRKIQREGICHFYPPRVIPLAEGGYRSVWPKTYAVDCCAQYFEKRSDESGSA